MFFSEIFLIFIDMGSSRDFAPPDYSLGILKESKEGISPGLCAY
jgi:hypothetical protein